MSRSPFQNVDVLTNSPQKSGKNETARSLTPQQNSERQERLAKALRENLLKRKEQMRARLLKIEETLNQAPAEAAEV